jgi:hypothetical protein
MPLDDFIDKERERNLFNNMLDGSVNARVLDIRADGGTGKTWLMRCLRDEAKELGVPVALAEFENWRPDSVELMRSLVNQFQRFVEPSKFLDFLRQDSIFHGHPQLNSLDTSEIDIDGDFRAAYLHNISGRDIYDIRIQQYRSPTDSEARRIQQVLTQLFLDGLMNLSHKRAVAILLDGMEHVTNNVSDWLLGSLLSHVRDSILENLVVILAGRPSGLRPIFEPHVRGEWLIVHKQLSTFERSHTKDYLRRYRIQLDKNSFETIHRATKDNPLALAMIAQGLKKEEDL